MGLQKGRIISLSLAMGFQVQGTHCHKTLLSHMQVFACLCLFIFWHTGLDTLMPKLNTTRREDHGHPHLVYGAELKAWVVSITFFFFQFPEDKMDP